MYMSIYTYICMSIYNIYIFIYIYIYIYIYSPTAPTAVKQPDICVEGSGSLAFVLKTVAYIAAFQHFWMVCAHGPCSLVDGFVTQRQGLDGHSQKSAHMYVCMHVCMYASTRVHTYNSLITQRQGLGRHSQKSAHIYVCTYVRTSVCTYDGLITQRQGLDGHSQKSARMYVCMHVCMYVCIYVCTHV